MSTSPDAIAYEHWIRDIKRRKKRGSILTRTEERALEGDQALQDAQKNLFHKGAYVEVKTDRGRVEGTILGKDEDGNFLVEYARGHHALIRPEFVVGMYKLRDTGLFELDQYVVGDGMYKRIVSPEGIVKKFLDPRMERRRASGEEIIFPEDEHEPGSDWGTRIE